MRYSANASSDHQPSQVPGTLKTINPKQPTLPICSIISTALLFQLFSKPSLHLTAKTMFGIIITTMKTKPNTLNHSIRVSPQILISQLRSSISCFVWLNQRKQISNRRACEYRKIYERDPRLVVHVELLERQAPRVFDKHPTKHVKDDTDTCPYCPRYQSFGYCRICKTIHI